MTTHFARSLQENLLVLLCFSEEHCRTVQRLVDVTRFDGLYQDVARRVGHYLTEFNRPPARHLSDLFEKELASDKRVDYERLLLNLLETSRHVNPTFVLSKLNSFLRIQALKDGIITAAQHLQQETDTSIDEAESILTRAVQQRVQCFEPGLFLGDTRALDCLQSELQTEFSTGIKPLDEACLGPSRKELHTFLANTNRGKSWWLVHLGKRALLRRQKVLHVSLEMSEMHVTKRYLQAIFAVGKQRATNQTSYIELDELGRFQGLESIGITPKLALDDAEIRTKLSEQYKRWSTRLNRLVIKEFPTGRLTIRELEGYLDLLDSTQRFVPDLLLLDYADLMRVDTTNYRMDIGRIFKELRGLAIDRNLAVVTVSQSNRTGDSATTLKASHVGEDFSKIQTSDVVISYNQTDQEENRGLARLYVVKSRNERARFHVLISQHYSTGQFCLQSVPLSQDYWSVITPEDPPPRDPPTRRSGTRPRRAS